MRIALLFVLSLCVLNVATFAQDKPATTAPSTAPSGEVVDIVAQKDKLKDYVGKDVTVRGKVLEVFVSNRTGITILNFFPAAERRLFNVVIDKADLEAVNAGFNGDLKAAVTDKTVLVTGTVAEFRGSPQIKVTKPDQIKIDESAAKGDAPKAEAKPVEVKK